MNLQETLYTGSLTSPKSVKNIPLREEIAVQDQWNLGHIFANRQSQQKAIVQLKQQLDEITTFKGKLSYDSTTLAHCLKKMDEIQLLMEKIFAYARMHRDIDAKNAKYQAMTAQAEELLAQTNAALSFIHPELLAIPKEILQKTVQTTPALSEFSFYIQNLLRLSEHVLSPTEEELLAKISELKKTPGTIFEMLAHADLEFPETPTESGEMVKLSEGRYYTLIRSTNRSVRKSAFENLFSAYAAFRNTLAATYSGSVKAAGLNSNIRKFPSSLAAALEETNIPTTVYSNVIDTIHQTLDPLHQYISLKKQALCLDEIHMYDLYTPLTRESNDTFPFEKGLKLVYDSLHPLGKQYHNDLSAGINNGWVDRYENQNKRTGAYSWGIYGVHPFVLLNYNDKYGAVSTLAHELGHAMHSFYSNQSQPHIASSYTIFCAEVASTTNEILLLNHMLKIEQNPQKRALYINQYLEQVRTTVYRQTMFAEFEKIVHTKAAQGEPLTADLLESIWLDLNHTYYGNEIIIDSLIKIEWARIPHFYRPFYVYQYATGYAAATALAKALENEGEAAQQRYLQYLKSGGSKYSIDLLKLAGVDMTTPQPLKVTLLIFHERLKELESLLKIS